MRFRCSCLKGVILALAIVLSFTLSASAANRYVRAGATGSGTGANWADAYTSLPSTLVRGDTYYVADGSYPAYTFNTVESGTSVITIKKASIMDHGTETGWNSAYGDGQAVFSSYFNANRGYLVIDGQYRNESDWFDGDAYGFKIQNTGNWQHMQLRDGSGSRAVSSITVKYMFIAAIVGSLPPGGQGYRPYAIDTATFSGTIRNSGYVFSRVFVDGSNNPFFVRDLVSPVIEYCASWRTAGSSTFHGECINLYYSNGGSGTSIVRYNHLRDCYNGVSGYPAGGGTAPIAIAYTSGVQIYGNIIEDYYGGDGAISAGWDNDNIKVFNNTFIDGGNVPLVRFPANASGNTGNEAINNLAVNCQNTSFSGVAFTASDNGAASTSIFVNYAARDFRLAAPTAAGAVLSSPYNVDMLGNTRGADGTFDRGAYEYGSVSATPVISVSPGALSFGSVTTNTAVDLTFTVRNAGSGTLSGSATVTAPFSIVSGGSYSLGTGQSQTMTVRFSPVVVGTQSRTVTFTGGGGASANVSGVAIVQVIADTTPPTVALGAPVAGTTVSELVTFSATASDNIGVAGVRFFVGGSEVSDDASAPYAYVWDSRWVNNGSYPVYAQARDAAGNSKWSATNVITVANTPTALPAPVAYWNFSEGTGTIANDNQSNNLLTLRNGAAMSAPGKFGSGLLLDGVNDRADAPNSPSLDVAGNAITVAAWVKLENQNDWQQILAKINAVGALAAPYYSWHLFGGHVSTTQWRPQFQLATTGQTEMGVNVSSAVNVNYGEWVHIVGVYDGTAIHIYVNGVAQGSAAQSGNILSFNQPLYIGAHGLPGEFAKGVVDEVRVYSRALSPTQVQTLYGFTDGIVIPAPPSELRIVGTE